MQNIFKLLASPTIKNSLSYKFRNKRFLHFLQFLKSIKTHKPFKILDIGGTEYYWNSVGFNDDDVIVYLLNLNKQKVTRNNFYSLVGNACELSMFVDKEFDLVFSNSTIEHLYSFENQQKMANEVHRVGIHYYIQTPNYYFPIEPHWVFPFFHYLPFDLKVFLTNNFNLGHYPKAKNINIAIERVCEVRLLTPKEMKILFPASQVYYEKLFGLKKSIIVYR